MATDQTTTNPSNPNPLAWLAPANPTSEELELITKQRLTNPNEVAQMPLGILVQVGLSAGLAWKMQEIARQLTMPEPVAPYVAPTAPIQTPVTTPAAVTGTPAPTAPAPAPASGPNVFSLVEATITEQIKRQLGELAGNNLEAKDELESLGVQVVVVGDNNLPLVNETIDMRSQMGGDWVPTKPEEEFWSDYRIISIRDVGQINFRSPVTLTALQGGKDSSSGTAWSILGREGLIVARCIYANNMTGGKDEETVFNDVRGSGPMTVRAQRRLSGNLDLRNRYEQEIAPRSQRAFGQLGARMKGLPSRTQGRPTPQGRLRGAVGRKIGANATRPLQDFLVTAFPSTEALREFALSQGLTNLPGLSTSRPEFAFIIAEQLGNAGGIESALMDIQSAMPHLSTLVARTASELNLSI